ncbi:DUF7742 family protein [Tateyamaria pelophila]
MRPVLAMDLICAGRAVLQMRPRDSKDCADMLVSSAMIADSYRVRSGSVHPQFGDGTLAEVARRFGMAPEPTVCDPEFSEALRDVLCALIAINSVTHRVSQ